MLNCHFIGFELPGSAETQHVTPLQMLAFVPTGTEWADPHGLHVMTDVSQR